MRLKGGRLTNEERDEVYEVVWSGGPGLIGERESKQTGIWTPPKRLYNWSGKYVGKFKAKPKAEPKIDTFGEG